MIAITRKKQNASDDVMSEHLPVILPSLLNLDDHDLLQPESKLDQYVPFQGGNNVSCRPISPHISQVEEVVRLIVEVLERMSELVRRLAAARDTHESNREGDSVVDAQPSLLSKSHNLLLLLDTIPLSQRHKYVVHNRCT